LTSSDLNIRLALILKTNRMKRSLTQQQVADILKINQSTYSRVELGEISLSVEQLAMVADFFSLSLHELLLTLDAEIKEEEIIVLRKILDELSFDARLKTIWGKQGKI
jgi:transcriptional regulator with XRE-family HTH domain